MKRWIILMLSALLFFGLHGCSDDGSDGAPGAQGEQGEQGPPGDPAGDPTTSVETCVGCHDDQGVAPVGDITDPDDPHFIDTMLPAPQTASGYRQLDAELTSVDVTGTRVVIEFDVTDENSDPVTDLFASDGRFTIARLDPGAGPGDSDDWLSLIDRIEDPGAVGTGDGSPETQANSERFTSGGGLFENLGGGSYRYSSAFDPTSVPIMAGETHRVAIQLSAGDLPAGNGWCDFDAQLVVPNDCVSAVGITRDIVQTATCNGCHGVTSDVRLALHGGGRTEVEYCVTCHNPGSIDANSDNTVDMKVMIHKLHYGAELSNLPYQIWGFRNSLHDYSTVNFTKDIDDCVTCHDNAGDPGAGADAQNWSTVPTIEACGSCHDDVDFETGANHFAGAQTNATCALGACHPQVGAWTPGAPPAPVETVHLGPARAMEAARYAYVIDDVSFDASTDELTVDYRVNQDGAPMDLETSPEWTAPFGASRLAITIGWDTADYTNEGGSEPASPISINGLDVGSAATIRGPNLYRVVRELPSSASDTVTASIEGHPAADLDGDGSFGDRIAVRNVFEDLNIDGGRAVTEPRRVVVANVKCNQCHDSAGQGISLHGNNRTGEVQVCAVCHNANNTDINRRPADPTMAVDGKKEEAIDFKRMIHQIHSGAELENGIVYYGFGGSVNDFGHVEFIGNRQNCETCHDVGSYDTVAAADALPSTVDTGADLADPEDDLNISPTAAVCSSCHDDDVAKDHMVLHGASFQALDDDIL
jgi:OmcA/MtrC family decaheme c-type cytochrome